MFLAEETVVRTYVCVFCPYQKNKKIKPESEFLVAVDNSNIMLAQSMKIDYWEEIDKMNIID